MSILTLAMGFAVLFSSIAVWGGSEPEDVAVIAPNNSQYVAHAPIRINSNADFNAAHGVTGGNGTKWNPWIIENWNINGTGYGYCFYVEWTTHYFILRNCFVLTDALF